MIPILYEKTETAFTSNGLGRLRDCLDAVCVEERNGVYELDFSYPVTGAHFDEIRVGRIVAVTHDDTGEIEPFDIVSYERPIDGVVKFHCTHISYRQKFYTVDPSIIDPTVSPEGSMLLLYGSQAQPYNPFWYESDLPVVMKYCPVFDGPPLSVRQFLGGTEGSILDTFGGEYEWDKFTVRLWQSRGQLRDFTIRYGVNMLDYNEQYSIEESYSACIPYWTDGTDKVIGDRQTGSTSTITGRGETIPLDVSDKFESKPTKAQVNTEGRNYLNTNRTAVPVQTITVEFARLQDSMPELSNLMTCRLCDSIRVIFPDYNASGIFKIVKTEWDVLGDKYEKMELGELSTTLAEALGISSSGSSSGGGMSVLDFYPVGSYYETSDIAFDPNVTWGGTWALDSAGRVTVARDTSQSEFDTIGETGGEKEHILVTDEMPSHTHIQNPHNHNAFRYTASNAGSGSNRMSVYLITSTNGQSIGTTADKTATNQNTGGGGAHNNLQPYVVVNRWHRTA